MRVAITGGTGFVGRRLARGLVARGHQAVLVARGKDERDESIYTLSKASFVKSDLSDPEELRRAFLGCDAVAHCAGINRELGAQTYLRVPVRGTKHVVKAARLAAVGKIVLLNFLRARPNCGSAYHESKWAAEEIVRGSRLSYTIFKAGGIYGRGDHMLDHVSHALYTFPIFGLVGMKGKPIGCGRSRSGKHRFVSRCPSLEQDREHYRAGRNRTSAKPSAAWERSSKTDAACGSSSYRQGPGVHHEDRFAVARPIANFVGRHRGGSPRLRYASRGFASRDALHGGANSQWIAGPPDHSVCTICVAARRARGPDKEERSSAEYQSRNAVLIDVGLVAILSISLLTHVKGHLQNLLFLRWPPN
jgi:NAD(P)H-binding